MQVGAGDTVLRAVLFKHEADFLGSAVRGGHGSRRIPAGHAADFLDCHATRTRSADRTRLQLCGTGSRSGVRVQKPPAAGTDINRSGPGAIGKARFGAELYSAAHHLQFRTAYAIIKPQSAIITKKKL